MVFALAVVIVAAQEKQVRQSAEPQTAATDSKTDEPVVEKFRVSGDPVSTPQMVAGSFGPIRCQDGDVLIRPIGANAGPLTSSLVRLSADGKSSLQFDLNTVPELSGKQFLAPVYALDKSGRAYFLVRLINPGNPEKEPLFLVAFSADGSYSWQVELDRTLWPYSLAVFSSGDFLISAMEGAPYERREQNGQQAQRPAKSFTGIFGRDGRLKRSLESAVEEGSVDTNQVAEDKAVIPKLQFGDAVTGPDGYVYLLRSPSEPRVEIWSEGGEQIRVLKLKPAMKDAQAGNLMVTDSALALRFLGPAAKDPKTGASRHADMIWAVYDSTTGEPLHYYDAYSVKGLLACFEREQFTFIVPKLDRMALLRVDIRQ